MGWSQIAHLRKQKSWDANLTWLAWLGLIMTIKVKVIRHLFKYFHRVVSMQLEHLPPHPHPPPIKSSLAPSLNTNHFSCVAAAISFEHKWPTVNTAPYMEPSPQLNHSEQKMKSWAVFGMGELSLVVKPPPWPPFAGTWTTPPPIWNTQNRHMVNKFLSPDKDHVILLHQKRKKTSHNWIFVWMHLYYSFIMKRMRVFKSI